MDILLIRPPRPPKTITIGQFMYCEPLGLEAVYGVLKKTFSVLLIDMMAEDIDISKLIHLYKPKCVGLTTICVDVAIALSLAEKIKSIDTGIGVVIGGTQAQLNPEAFISPFVDHIMAKSTEDGITSLFTALVTGSSCREISEIDGVYSRGGELPLPTTIQHNDFLAPDRSATHRYRHKYSYFGFRPCAILQTSQGCRKRCTFCIRWRIEGGEENHRDIVSVCQEIVTIEEDTIMIIDNDFLCDSRRIESLCDFLEKNRIKKNFLCYGSVHSIMSNRKSIRRFKRNGLRVVLVGYESFSEHELTAYNKQCSLEDSLEVSRFLKTCGIDAWASFIMHPDWSHDDFSSFRKYIRKLRPEISSLTPLTAYPGTPYYEKYKERLLIKKNDYARWSFGEITIMPTRMSLKAYYCEVLKTNLHINLFMNNTVYLVRKFGWSALFRISWGGLKLTATYLRLMARV